MVTRRSKVWSRVVRRKRMDASRWAIASPRWRKASADFADVRDMRLDKVVEKIRGKKGTRVRLLVIPADAADPSKRKTIELVRDEIKLKDQEARADIIIKKDRRRRCR